MDEWKVRQEIFHKLTPVHTDDLNDVDIVIDYSNIVQQTLDHFTKPIDELIFPAKTFFVAIVYADLLHRAFGVTMVESLNDPTLLFQTSPFFKTYDEAFVTYDEILNNLPPNYLQKPPPQLIATINYFKEEFMMDSHPVDWKTPIPLR